jgi:hypothetical protein
MLELYEMFPKPYLRDISAIRARIDSAVGRFPKGVFIRLGSRSPKDSWIGHEKGFRCLDGGRAIEVLLGLSERVTDDLLLAIKEKYPPHIFVREWIDIPKWAEFRCFCRGKKLVGVSQYNYLDAHMPEIEENMDSIKWAIELFFDDFRQATHLDDVVFDVFVVKRTSGNATNWQVKLLEINPFFEHTDPCLFDWRKSEGFDGSFRFVKKDSRA